MNSLELTEDEVSANILDNDHFQTSVFAQYEVIRSIQGWMKDVPFSERHRVTKKFAGSFPRCREMRDPQNRLWNIALLDTKDDILDALEERHPTREPLHAERLYLNLPGFLGEYCRMAQHTNAPVAFHFWSALTMLASAVGGQYVLRLNGTHKLNLITCLAADDDAERIPCIRLAIEVMALANESLTEGAESIYREPFQVPVMLDGEMLMVLMDSLERIANEQRLVMDAQGKGELVPYEASVLRIAHEFMEFSTKGSFPNAYKWVRFLVAMATGNTYQHVSMSKNVTITPDNLCFNLLAATDPDQIRGGIRRFHMQSLVVNQTNIIYREVSSSIASSADQIPIDPIAKRATAKLLSDVMSRPYTRRVYAPEYVRLSEGASQLLREYFKYEGTRRTKSNDREHHHNHPICVEEILICKVAVLLAISADDFKSIIEASYLQLAMDIVTAEHQCYAMLIERLPMMPNLAKAKVMLAFLTKRSRLGKPAISMADIGRANHFASWDRYMRLRALGDLQAAERVTSYVIGEMRFYELSERSKAAATER